MRNLLLFLCILFLAACVNATDWRAPFIQKSLQPGETVSSLQGELPDVGEVEWEIECDGEIDASLELFDIVGKSLTTQALPAKQGTFTPPVNAAGFVLTIKNIDSRPLDLGYLGVETAKARNVFHDAEWIWEPHLEEKPGTYAIFRTNFKIADLDDLDAAFLYITADDRVIAHLNTTDLVGPHSGGYINSDSFAILNALKNGSNTLTCRVLNGGGPGGLLCEVHLHYKSGRKVVIPSSGDWKCAIVQENDEWRNKSTSTKPIVLGKAGCQPWGKLAYYPVTQFTARLTGLNIPHTADENTVWTPKPVLHLAGDDNVFGADCFLSIRLRSPQLEVFVADAVIPKSTLAALKDGPQTIELEPIYFTYIPDGKYSIEVKLDNAMLLTEKLHDIVVQRNPDTPHGMPTVELVDKELIPQFLIDGEEKVPVTQYLIDPTSDERALGQQQLAFRSGVQTLWIHHPIQYDENGEPYFHNLDSTCVSALCRSPNVVLVVNPAVDCVQSPMMTKFFEENPDELCQNSEGSTDIFNDPSETQKPVKCNSMASEKWLAEAERVLGILLDHLDTVPYGKRVVCIAPSCGITWEWMHWGSERLDECTDYSKPFQTAFRGYLQKKYGTPDALSKAWKKSYADFNQVTVPTFDERRVRPEVDFLNPAENANLMDLSDFIAEMVSGDIIRLCSFIKRYTQNRMTTCVYYGYYNMITPPRWMQGSGHWGLSRVLASDAVDMIQAPSTYNERGPGEPGGFMPPESAITAAGKILVDESDVRTHHTTNPLGLCGGLQESRGVIEREWAMCLANNASFRYYDFSQGWTFGDPRLADLASYIAKAETEVMDAQPQIRAPEDAIAVVISENSMPMLQYYSNLNSGFVSVQYRQFPRTGAAFKIYITPGLENIPLTHKVWFFENPYKLTQGEVDYIKANILKPGNTVIFGYGANVLDADGNFTIATMKELTGLHFAIDYNGGSSVAKLTSKGKVVLENPAVEASAPTVPFAPKFYPQGDGKILARDAANNIVLAESQVNGCRVIFSSLHTIPASWLRAIARQTGLLVYDDTEGDITWGSGDIVGIHTPTAGPRVIHTRHSTGTAKNLLTGQELPIENGQFSYTAREKGTDVFLVK